MTWLVALMVVWAGLSLPWVLLSGWVALLVQCPIFKPWFGFRKPTGHPGKWGQ